ALGAGDGYITSLDCGDVGTMTLTPSADSRSATLAVGSSPSDVTCTFTNTPRTAGVALQKQWAANSNVGDGAALGLVTAPSGAQDSATSTAPAAPIFGGPSNNTAFVAVVAGDVVTFTEDLGAAAANYTTTFDCLGATNAPQPGADASTWTLLIDTADVASGDTIFCSFTNTRIEVDLVLEKDWDDAAIGDTVTLSAAGSDTAPIGYQSVAETDDETDTSVAFTVFAGETLSLAETWDVGDSAAYDTSLTCVGGNDTDVSDGELTIDPGDTSITCTWVNARRSVNVVVAKALAPAGDDGSFDLSIDGGVEVAGATDGSSNAASPVTVLVGDGVAVSEAAEAGSPALVNYASSLACDNGVTVSNNTGTSGDFVVPSSLASDTTITCTFTNTRRQAPLTVVKSWADSPQNGDTVSLTISGGLATPDDGVDSNDGNDVNDDPADTTVYAGETITVAEAFSAGSAVNYDTTVQCVDAAGDLVPVTASSSVEFDVPSAPTAITCTFTNTRIRGELTLRKQWTNAAAGDTADLTVAGQDSASPATAQSTAILGNSTDDVDTAVLTVYSGETVDLDETVVPGVDYVSSLTCDGSVMAPTGSSRSHDLTITPGDRDAQIVCTFRNVRKQITVELTKDWSTSPANGDAVALSIGGTLMPATDGANSNNALADDSDARVQALAGETVTLTESFSAGLPENYTTSLACVDALGAPVGADLTYVDGALSGQLAIDAADAGTTVTCTFTN
ncbi:MAG: hypothetical protein HKN41_07360, partial [Ilumatobacter sp.]|nr:hypothetical protein [Ilumatobacter sp.]